MNPPADRRGGPALLLVPLLPLLAACSRTPGYKDGCYLNDAVRPETRRELEAAAERFYSHLRARRYEAAYQEASEQLRQRTDKSQIAATWTHAAEVVTIPEVMTTKEIAVVVFPEGTRGPQEIQCIDPADPGGGRTMLTTDQRYQAYLIQATEMGGAVTTHYGSTWFHEGGRWRLAAFGGKPSKIMGQGTEYYADWARREAEKKNFRNAAILYNIAMDLLVPAPWVRPDGLDRLRGEQRKLRVQDLPKGRVSLRWVALDGTEFYPYLAGYDVTDRGLAFKLNFEVPDSAQATRVAADAPKLADFVRSTFPEYTEVFADLWLVATSKVQHEVVWEGRFPIRGRP